MNGYTAATCLDLNQGYYHFVLDKESFILCGIALPWGTYYYRILPQGLMVSSNIFQERIPMIFSDFDNIIVYIHYIILYTKSTFDHRSKRLGIVLEQLCINKRVEDTFLASKRVAI